MTDPHIAPDDFTFGAIPARKAVPEAEPEVMTPDDRAKAVGFPNDSGLRRWCVDEVVRSKVCYALSTEARALYDFLTEAA